MKETFYYKKEAARHKEQIMKKIQSSTGILQEKTRKVKKLYIKEH